MLIANESNKRLLLDVPPCVGVWSAVGFLAVQSQLLKVTAKWSEPEAVQT